MLTSTARSEYRANMMAAPLGLSRRLSQGRNRASPRGAAATSVARNQPVLTGSSVMATYTTPRTRAASCTHTPRRAARARTATTSGVGTAVGRHTERKMASRRPISICIGNDPAGLRSHEDANGPATYRLEQAPPDGNV